MTPVSTRSLKSPPEVDVRLTNIYNRLDKITTALEQSLRLQGSAAEGVHVSFFVGTLAVDRHDIALSIIPSYN